MSKSAMKRPKKNKSVHLKAAIRLYREGTKSPPIKRVLCQSKKKNVMELSFADAESMNRYVTETGKILPRKFTGLSSKEQRHIKKTIKHARNMLLMK